jgi:hypothetical protein
VEPPYDRAADAWPYRTMSPERFAALNAHRIGYLGLEEWTHRPEVYDWLVEVDANRRDPERLAECRLRWLSGEEQERVMRESART